MRKSEPGRDRQWASLACALAFTAALLAPSAAPAASFDCGDARTADEIAICGNRDLNDADVEMATRYTMLLQLLAMGSAAALKDDQAAWLAWRHACYGDVTCLRSAYRARISALKSQFKRIASRGPF